MNYYQKVFRKQLLISNTIVSQIIPMYRLNFVIIE